MDVLPDTWFIKPQVQTTAIGPTPSGSRRSFRPPCTNSIVWAKRLVARKPTIATCRHSQYEGQDSSLSMWQKRLDSIQHKRSHLLATWYISACSSIAKHTLLLSGRLPIYYTHIACCLISLKFGQGNFRQGHTWQAPSCASGLSPPAGRPAIDPAIQER